MHTPKVEKLNLGADNEYKKMIRDTILDLDNLNTLSVSECVMCLYRVLANSHHFDSYNEAISTMMSLGLKRFSADLAMLSHPISGTVHEVAAYAGNTEDFYIGQHVGVRSDLCHQVSNDQCILNLPKVENRASQSSTLAYNHTQIGAYLGSKIAARSSRPDVLCFISHNEQPNAYTPDDLLILDLMAEGIACMSELQTAQAQRKRTDVEMFTSGSLKSLEEYLEQAKIPEMIGVPAKVIEALQKRVGQSSLSIGNIAEELNLSKRTLQRRLYQHEVSFADLRDQVRFHYSIDYLIQQHMSIDSISVCLDFSDRTSFTNAFKRWTGLSPSTFRKIFRDYV